MLGVGFAVLLAIMNAMWGENEAGRAEAAERSDDWRH
jgi:predicted outer membrane lipoprotein